MRLKNMTKNNIIAEFLQSNKANEKAYTELTENEHIKLFMNVASLYINNQLNV